MTTRILTAVLRLGFDVERKFGLYCDINEISKKKTVTVKRWFKDYIKESSKLGTRYWILACSELILKCAQTPRIGLNV